MKTKESKKPVTNLTEVLIEMQMVYFENAFRSQKTKEGIARAKARRESQKK